MARPGRPRSFDREEALQGALELFWARGYEGLTLEDLQRAMGGISPPSFYAAFGSKEQLFREVVERYVGTVGRAQLDALDAAATARGGVEAMLREAVKVFCSGTARGCMLIVSAMNCTPANQPIEAYLSGLRRQAPKIIQRRLERGVEDGDVPVTADLAALASFYTTILHGIGLRARDGASHAALLQSVTGAMAAWDALAGARGRARRKSRARSR